MNSRPSYQYKFHDFQFIMIVGHFSLGWIHSMIHSAGMAITISIIYLMEP